MKLSVWIPSIFSLPQTLALSKGHLNLFITPEIRNSYLLNPQVPFINQSNKKQFNRFPFILSLSISNPPFLGLNKQNTFSVLRKDWYYQIWYHQNWKLNTFPIMVFVRTNCIWNCLIISNCKFTISRWHASLGEELQKDNA